MVCTCLRKGVMTNLGIRHEAGHPEPWIIAIDAAPTRASVLDDAARGAIEPMFSDVRGQGFDPEESQRQHAERLERLVLIMALAMDWCVGVGRDDALSNPTALEKSLGAKQPRALALAETLSQSGLVVHTWTASAEAVPAKRPAVARFSATMGN
jgi:hypothetical protein